MSKLKKKPKSSLSVSSVITGNESEVRIQNQDTKSGRRFLLSTSFLSPLTNLGNDLRLKRNRKRRNVNSDQGDDLSVCSLQLQDTFKEPTSKRVKTLRKSVVSFANLISPGKPKGKLQRSSSFKESVAPAYKPYRPPGSGQDGGSNTGPGANSLTPGGRKRLGTTVKHRRCKLWRDTFDSSGLDEAELKRQEAIFEVYRGECDMVDDLKMAKQTYRDSMMTLKMLSEKQVSCIFGKLDCLLPLHEDLISRLEKARCDDGRTHHVGHVFIDWLPTLSPYNEYCANQADAKETLDAVISRERRVRDFLQRCLESPFSRKLDLWSYLDLPRTRLVKYPLLLKAILKVTPSDHPDIDTLDRSLSMVNEIITRVDDLTGERQCKFVQSKLEYLDEKKKCPEVEASRKIICSGQLKNNRGTKLQVFLFDLALVLTRNATRRDKLSYQIHRQPLPLTSVQVETDESGKQSGSFRGGLLASDKNGKHSFRVKSEQLGVAYTLTATDEHDKKQWINSLVEAIKKVQATSDVSAQRNLSRESSAGSSSKDKAKKKVRRSSSLKSLSDKLTEIRQNGSSPKSKDKKLDEVSSKSSSSSAAGRSKKDSDPDEVVPLIATDADDKVFEDANSCRRSRSLNASPVAPFNALRTRSNYRELSKSESCNSKPPSGRVSSSSNLYSLHSRSKTPPRSPRLHTTRSTPDFLNILSRKSPVSKRRSGGELERILSNDDELDGGAPESLKKNASFVSTTSGMSYFMVDSPDHPAPSNTSQSFPIVEEDAVSPVFKSLSSLHHTLSSPSISVSFPTAFGPMINWSRESRSDADTSSSRTSSESLDDVPLVVDDVETILESFGDGEGKGADDTFSHCISSRRLSDVTDGVSSALDDVISQVCESCSDAPPSERAVVTHNEHYIIIASDDGLPWQGDSLEMSA